LKKYFSFLFIKLEVRNTDATILGYNPKFKYGMNLLDPNGLSTRGRGQIDCLTFTGFRNSIAPSATLSSFVVRHLSVAL
jgi:hypothetical protein